ncbi:hypothetical protein [Thioclava sp. GXIMD4216]|uniref:Lipoprotein-attachment site-containing protein n=1 Tax=Thioclava litoralis TaxID=3076557 RepID=A0ABZ1DYS5_9RHOB|nr:hypothetical protein RPE78_09980 [Thioclava sp. FTW29]
MSTKLILALGLVGFMAACAPKPEPQPVMQEPVTTEPVYHSKL